MQTPSFLANPIGVDYDPDEAIARLEAGVITYDRALRARADADLGI